MDVIEALKSRHSVRAYLDKQVDNETLLKILEAANNSPSWASTQPWEIYVAAGAKLEKIRERYLINYDNEIPRQPDVPGPTSWPEAHKKRTLSWGRNRLLTQWGVDPDKDTEELAALQKENAKYNGKFFGAPAVFFLCMDKDLSSWSLFDIGCVSQSLMLAAEHYGVSTGTAFHFACYPDILREELGIPDNLNILIGIAAGYKDNESIQNKYIATRRPIEECTKIITE